MPLAKPAKSPPPLHFGLRESLVSGELDLEERTSLLLAVAYDDEMVVGETRWARQVKLGQWERVDPAVARTPGVPYATVTRNVLFGPRIEYKEQHQVATGGLYHVGTLSKATSRSEGHVELGARLTIAEAGHGGDGGVSGTVNESGAHGGTDRALSYRVGVGVTSGGGIKDDSLSVKALGTGLTIGRRIGLSFLDTEIGIDVYKLFGRGGSSKSDSSSPRSPSTREAIVGELMDHGTGANPDKMVAEAEATRAVQGRMHAVRQARLRHV